MRIMGIDPGFGIIGFGVIEKNSNSIQVLDYGVIRTPKELTLIERLEIIYDSIVSLVKEWQPENVAVEELYWGRNITTGIPVAEARGVILLALKQSGLAIYEYNPLQVKMALTGTGKADKSQMQFMVRTLLGLEKVPRPDDAADALAIAVCHSQTNQRLR